MTTSSAGSARTAPTLELLATLSVRIDPPFVIGGTTAGLRRIIPIVGGSVDGPHVRGDVLPVGGDWNTWHETSRTGTAQAQYAIRTHDGVVIGVTNTARHTVPDSDEPIYTHPILEAPAGPYAWLNHVTLVGTLRPGVPDDDGDRVVLEFWALGSVGDARGDRS